MRNTSPLADGDPILFRLSLVPEPFHLRVVAVDASFFLSRDDAQSHASLSVRDNSSAWLYNIFVLVRSGEDFAAPEKALR